MDCAKKHVSKDPERESNPRPFSLEAFALPSELPCYGILIHIFPVLHISKPTSLMHGTVVRYSIRMLGVRYLEPDCIVLA